MDLIQDLGKKKVSNIEKKPNKMDGEKNHQSKWQTYWEVQRNRKKTGERSKQLLLESSFSWKVIHVALVETGILTHWACL